MKTRRYQKFNTLEFQIMPALNLIAPAEMSDMEINEFYSNLREVMLYIKYSSDKEKLNKIIKEDSKFQNVGRQAANVINVVTGSKLKYPEGRCKYVPGYPNFGIT